MANLALYRKYRPKSWSEVVGQDHIVRTLTNSLNLKRISHAYLFCGPKGTGKTTLARLFAKALNCINIAGHEPCNSCVLCIDINESRALDLIEIDAASNRGIDEIRELRDGIKFSPVLAKYKVFIIDEAHMLTKEAFNALLKTLEEPPAHAVFILATTEPRKLPQTILSRVQRFDFKKLSADEILKKLKRIVAEENIKVDDGAVELIAFLADGSSRDAESILDQLRSTFPDGIDQKTVQDFLGVIDISKTRDFISLLVASDAPGAVRFIKELDDRGESLGEFTKACLEYLRKMIFVKVDEKLALTFSDELSEEIISGIKEQAQGFKLETLSGMANILMAVGEDIKKSPIPVLPLEIAVLDIMNLKTKN